MECKGWAASGLRGEEKQKKKARTHYVKILKDQIIIYDFAEFKNESALRYFRRVT